MGLEAKDLELVIETTTFIFQQAAYHLAKPAQLKAHLTNIALDDDKVCRGRLVDLRMSELPPPPPPQLVLP